MADMQPQVVDLRFEHLPTAFGIGVAQPRLSWIVQTQTQDWKQAAYAIEAIDADGAPLAQTGRIASSESVLVAWPFAPLASRERRTVRVQVWGEDGVASPWSAAATVEVGLLEPDAWQARFVSPDWDEDNTRAQPAPLLRREFDVQGAIQRARLYITAHGVYTAEINGAAVGDDVMAPGWTSYDHRLRYQTYDVTALLHTGRNALGAMVGEGWYRGRLGYHHGRRNIYGDRAALLAQLEIEYTDGTRAVVATDANWRAATGPILASEIYDGETYDARLEKAGWSSAGFDDSTWHGVRFVERDLTTLVAPTGPAVRRTEVRAPVSVTTSPSGKTIVDFGQNLVGTVRIRVQGAAGQTVTLRFAEVLEGGELCTRPLRYARVTDHYTLRGGEVETWEPRFTFHGFRYAEVSGWPSAFDANAISANVSHSDMERTGWFACSNPLVNQLHENVIWSMRGNFFDVPTDCPQRDERLGWTGDIQVFTPTASFLYNVAGFLQSWLGDLAAEQAAAGGIVPYFVPNVMAPPPSPAAAWGDAAVVVPWVLYQRYGDKAILAQQFESMRTWVDQLALAAGSSRLWDKGFQFGDWLDPKAAPEKAADARTAPFIVATAYFAYSAELLAQAAAVLGDTETAQHYHALAGDVRAAFANAYVTPAGRLVSDATTAYTLALQFALLPTPAQRSVAGRRLAELVRGDAYHISTGFVGTPLVCDALCDAGEYAAAYRLLLQESCPSWLYPVTMGATTIWERWDSMLPNGAINPGEMTSFNHYALGAVADWLHRTVAGLAPAEPGYRRIVIRPVPGGQLAFAQARHRTPYGMAASAWRIEGGMITVEVEVPANSSATVYLPGQEGDPVEVGAGSHSWSYAYSAPSNAMAPLTLDSTIEDLIENQTVFDTIMETIAREHLDFKNMIEGQPTVTLRQAIGLSPSGPALQASLTKVIAELAS